MKYILSIFFSFSLSCWAQSSDADLFKESLRRFQEKRYEDSCRVLNVLLKKSPRNSLYWFNYGNCSFMRQDYAQAYRAFRTVVVLKGALSPAARLYLAKTLKAMGQHDKASRELAQLSMSSLPKALAQAVREDAILLDRIDDSEQSALQSYQANEFEKAEAQLRQHEEDELSVDGRILLGMIELKEKKYAQAERVFRNLRALPGLGSQKRELTSDLLKRARHGESGAHPYWLFVDFAYGTTDNAFADGESVAPLSSPLSRIQLGVGYQFNQKRTWSQKLGYSLFRESPERASETEVLNQSLRAVLLYQRPELDFSLTPYFLTQTWGQRLVGQRTGVAMKGVASKDPFEYGAEADFSNQESRDADFSYFKGPAQSFRPYVGWWDQNLYAQIFWLWGADRLDDIVYTDGSVLPLGQRYQGPGLRLFWRPTDLWTASFWLSYLRRDFDHQALPGPVDRMDQETSLSLKLAYWIRPTLSLYQSTEWISNKSTLGATEVRDKNYHVLTLVAGLSWDVF